MCVQCMAGASLCVGSASGMRAWLAMRNWRWLTPTAMRRLTIALMSAAVLASTVVVSGAQPTPSPSDSDASKQTPAQQRDARTVGGVP